MVEVCGVWQYEGCNFFRQRLVLATLSQKSVRLVNIRPFDDDPGIRDFESKCLELLDEVTNGSTFEISPTGTTVFYRPGMLHGGRFELDCGTDRSLGYYLEVLCGLAPFCKAPLHATLHGTTNCGRDPSVDVLKAAWFPVVRRFGVDGDGLDMKVIKRGLPPNGGGTVLFTCPVVRQLVPVHVEKQGKVAKVRGVAYTCKVSPTMATRMIEAAKARLRLFLGNVYLYSDHRKGVFSGNSPGFGIVLQAETTEGVVFTAECISNPAGSDAGPSVPEDLGEEVALRLCQEIYRGGCCDSTAQGIAFLFMSITQKEVSSFVTGPLSTYSVAFLRHIKDFFGVQFQIDGVKGNGAVTAVEQQAESGEEDQQQDSDDRLPQSEKVKLVCLGSGYTNINKMLI